MTEARIPCPSCTGTGCTLCGNGWIKSFPMPDMGFQCQQAWEEYYLDQGKSEAVAIPLARVKAQPKYEWPPNKQRGEK